MALIDTLKADPSFYDIDPSGQSDCYFRHRLPDGSVVQVVPLTFGRARIVWSGTNPRNVLDNSWEHGF